MVKVTVATVCYNSENTIEKTIKSVIDQSYDNIEYLIVDGASSDNTINIIKSYSDDRIKLVSEPDNGLYDAMNKAAVMATGDYIIYMNSGDVFASSRVIEKVSVFLDGKNEMVYGNVIREKPKGKVFEKYGNRFIPMMLLLQGKMICHQSIFTRCDIMRKYAFDTQYTITADYDFLVRFVHDKGVLKHADLTVSIVDNIEGISSTVGNMDEMRKQDDDSLKKHFPGWYYVVKLPKSLVRKFRRQREKNKEF